MKLISVLIGIAAFFAVFTGNVLAIEDPFSVTNNKFGIHITDEGDLEAAAKLVNSNGGDWGYVTIVIQEGDKNSEKWQRIFDKMSEFHLIPLVRIAGTPVSTRWEKLDNQNINSWVSFLDSLSWPTVNRYVIVGNEPNHAKEWGGQVKPEEYANYLVNFSQKAKEKSADFFILPAGLDAAAPNLPGYMSEEKYIKTMLEAEPAVFDHIDGWTSHSYPNPAFSGSETATGKTTIKGFAWEKEYLKSLGIEKDFPVFITETGWIHDLNGKYPILTDTEKLGEKYKYAYESVWNDPDIVAVTPFILNYSSFPFESFSWKDKDGQFFKFYYDVQALSKVGGNPKRIDKKKVKPTPTPLPYMDFAYHIWNIDKPNLAYPTWATN